MLCLSDFWLSLNLQVLQMINGLGEVLWSVCRILIFSKLMAIQSRSFSITNFYCHAALDISQIIKSQTELQIIALNAPGGPRKNILKTLKEFHNAQLFLPIIVTFEREISTTLIDRISIFPEFYSADRRTTIPLLLAQSFCKDENNYMFAKADYVHELSIYLIDPSDMPSIYALVKDIAVTFSQIGYINLFFERRCKIVSFLFIADNYKRA